MKYLNKKFQEKIYLTLEERLEISEKLHLSEEKIKNWFQNKRMKTKRDYVHAVDKGIIVPLENPRQAKFSRMTENYFKSIPIPSMKLVTNNSWDFRETIQQRTV